jgi:phosphoglucosamine mutase
MKTKYFGTDGVRGVFGSGLSLPFATNLGRAIAKYFGRKKIIIGRDSRVSGEQLLDALSRGINTEGGTPVYVGILPTPAIAVLTKQEKACCGIVISASHNPPEYNGIKVFDGNGLKLSEVREAEIEKVMEELVDRENGITGFSTLDDAKQRYISYITSLCPKDLGGLTVRLDCCFGATARVAGKVFESLGAKVYAYNNEHNGNKINVGVGALHPEWLLAKMEGADEIGFSFDGDGDRVAVIMGGEVVDGDSVIYNLSRALELNKKTVVGTVLNNLALEQALKADGVDFKRTSVGDKYISNLMTEHGYTLGGEQSGHLIINSEAGCATGDAILSGAFLLNTVYHNGKINPLVKLALCPQKALSMYADKSIVLSKEMKEIQHEANAYLGENGRVIVRMSGTEPKVRVMVEAINESDVDLVLEKFRVFIEKATEGEEN